MGLSVHSVNSTTWVYEASNYNGGINGLLTYLLHAVLLEQLTSSKLVKKFPTFYMT